MIAIAFVDGGFISRGTKVALVDEVFGTAFARRAGKTEAGEVDWGIVPLGSFVVPPEGQLASPYYVGWVLAVAFDRRGLVSQYYLTKEWK